MEITLSPDIREIIARNVERKGITEEAIIEAALQAYFMRIDIECMKADIDESKGRMLDKERLVIQKAIDLLEARLKKIENIPDKPKQEATA